MRLNGSQYLVEFKGNDCAAGGPVTSSLIGKQLLLVNLEQCWKDLGTRESERSQGV